LLSWGIVTIATRKELGHETIVNIDG